MKIVKKSHGNSFINKDMYVGRILKIVGYYNYNYLHYISRNVKKQHAYENNVALNYKSVVAF